MEISIKELESLGWEYKGMYWAGQNTMYEKNGQSLRVDNYVPSIYENTFNGIVKVKDSETLETAKQLLTYTGAPMRSIESLEELEEYATTGK